MFRVPDHPEITWAERTGHPSWNQPKEIRCDYCSEELWEDEVFQDEQYAHLCKDCLLSLHRLM